MSFRNRIPRVPEEMQELTRILFFGVIALFLGMTIWMVYEMERTVVVIECGEVRAGHDYGLVFFLAAIVIICLGLTLRSAIRFFKLTIGRAEGDQNAD